MIITRTPVRVSLLGGGTDFPDWASQHGGLVVGGSIDKYGYITARRYPPFHEYRHRLVYQEVETVASVTEFRHRAVKAVLRHTGWPDKEGIEISHLADLPGRSGTGSSSTFIVGLLNALASLRGCFLANYELAQEAIHVEQTVMGETVGCQDQVWAAYGGVNLIRFKPNGEILVVPLSITTEHVRELENHLLLFFTKQPRNSSEVAKGYASSLQSRRHEQFALMRMAELGVEAILRKNWTRLGELVDQSWRVKSSLPGVTNPEINKVYAAARLAGAFGGKLTGAGGGGCLLLVAPPEKHERILRELSGENVRLVHVPFRFEFDGSTVIFTQR